MRIYIDNHEVDTDSTTRVSVTLSAAAATAPEWNRSCRASGITIPSSPRNRSVMGDAEQLHSAQLFNSERHTVRVEQCGAVVAEGDLFLKECAAGDGGRYCFDIMGEGNDWVLSALGRIGELPIEYSAAISAVTIAESWTATAVPVRFLPVDRNRPDEEIVGTPLLPKMRFLNSNDYHPFLHVKTLVEAIFGQSGWTVVSNFFASSLFGSLYISGRYAERDTAALVERMDFKAGRTADSATVVANALGRVYANPNYNYSTVGNIVTTAATDAVDAGGNLIEGLFSNGNCFSISSERAAFTPKTEVSVGFCYRMVYDTGYRILSRSRLKGFDTIYLHSGDKREFTIPNTFADRRSETLSGTMQYRVVVFEHQSGSKYKLRATLPSNVEVDLALFESRSALCLYGSSAVLTSPRLYIWNGSAYTAYGGDWALYDGYVGETGTQSVDLTLREAPAIHSPSSPKYFNTIWFGGAESGMNFTLKAATTVRPVFVPHPTEGSTVRFTDLTVGMPTQIALLEALGQMFNLKFYSDCARRRVFVEPADALFADGATFDWRERTDTSQPIVIEELGADRNERETFGYRSGDGTADNYDAIADEPFADWTAQVAHRFAARSTRRFENGLFTPSISASNLMRNATAALLIGAGDRTAEPYDEVCDDLNFPTKIVRYAGMTPLPENQFWGWPLVASDYPLAAFHLPPESSDEPFTLCFGDRDSLCGLHSYRESDYRRMGSSRRITAALHICPDEVEELLRPNDCGRDLRALFRLNVGGEEVRCRIEEMCGYNPEEYYTKCKFITE